MSLEAPPSAAALPVPAFVASQSLKRTAEDEPTPTPGKSTQDTGGGDFGDDALSSAFKVSRYQALAAAVPLGEETTKQVLSGVTKPLTPVDTQTVRSSYVVKSTKGYLTSQPNFGVASGAWFFECVVSNLGETGHVRVGWGKRLLENDTPVGADGDGFAYCDVWGEKVSGGRREKYGDPFAAGDVIGCYLELPVEEWELQSASGEEKKDSDDEKTEAPAAGEDTSVQKEQKGAGLGATDPDNTAAGLTPKKQDTEDVVGDKKEDPQKEKKTRFGFVSFAKNGVPQGDAFSFAVNSEGGGAYFPSVSLYTLSGSLGSPCEVGVNFGPQWIHQLPGFGNRATPKPMCDA